MNFKELAKNRYSCRKFSSIPVEQKKINSILESAISAPTAKNLQPYKIWRIESELAQTVIHNATPCTFGAKEFLLIGAKREEAWVRPFDNANFSIVDASIVATHILLAIESEGLSSTWVAYFNAPEIQKQLPETAGYDLIALFPIGYAAEDAAPSEMHSKRRAISEAVSAL